MGRGVAVFDFQRGLESLDGPVIVPLFQERRPHPVMGAGVFRAFPGGVLPDRAGVGINGTPGESRSEKGQGENSSDHYKHLESPPSPFCADSRRRRHEKRAKGGERQIHAVLRGEIGARKKR